jgi:hypothetical protein
MAQVLFDGRPDSRADTSRKCSEFRDSARGQDYLEPHLARL